MGGGRGAPSGEGGGGPPPIREFVSLRSQVRGGGAAPPPRAHLQISDVSDQVVPDFSIAQETILVNRNSRKLQGASFRDNPYISFVPSNFPSIIPY